MEKKLTNLMRKCINSYVYIEDLLPLKNELEKTDSYGNTAFIYLCRYCKNISKDLVKFFEREIDISNNNYTTPLMYLCSRKDNIPIEIIKCISSNIGNKNAAGMTALMYLCQNCQNINKEIIKELEDEIEMTNNHGQNALIILCKYNPYKFPLKIFYYMRDIANIEDNYGKNSFDYLFERTQDKKIVELAKNLIIVTQNK